MSPQSVPLWGVPVALVLAIAWVLTRYEYHEFQIEKFEELLAPQIVKGSDRVGHSMAYVDTAELRRGDVVRFQTARTGSRSKLSRVVALPGERVRVVAGTVQVDGAPIEDPYAQGKRPDDWFPELRVPAGCVFVLNDRRSRHGSASFDSRTLGPIPVASIRYRFPPREPVRGVRGR